MGRRSSSTAGDSAWHVMHAEKKIVSGAPSAARMIVLRTAFTARSCGSGFIATSLSLCVP
jgi:hypothetical protein